MSQPLHFLFSILALVITGAASVTVQMTRCSSSPSDFTIPVGGSCSLRCVVEDLDEKTQYVALQKTVRVYRYDKAITYGPKDMYTSNDKFVEEITNTNRYTDTITGPNERKEYLIEFTNAVLGDSGTFECVVKRISDNSEIVKSQTAEIPVRGGEVELQFGLRKEGTTGSNIEIVKTFTDNQMVIFEDKDFENLVYIAEMKGVSYQTPRVKIEIIETNGINTSFEFEDEYHTPITNNEDLIPDFQNDITYLYDPTSQEKRDMRLRGEYAYGLLGTSFDVELKIETNSGLRISHSAPMILTALLLLIKL